MLLYGYIDFSLLCYGGHSFFLVTVENNNNTGELKLELKVV